MASRPSLFTVPNIFTSWRIFLIMSNHSVSGCSSFNCGWDLRTARSSSEGIIADARERASVSTRKPVMARPSRLPFNVSSGVNSSLCKFSLSEVVICFCVALTLVFLLIKVACFLDPRRCFVTSFSPDFGEPFVRMLNLC